MRSQPDPGAQPPHLTSALPWRLTLLAGGLLLGLTVLQIAVALPPIVELFRRILSLALLVGLGWLGILTVTRNRRAFLWRVRRKLILSFIFIGVVPLVLVGAFVLTGGMLLYTTVTSYVFYREIESLVDDVRQVAEVTALEVDGGGDVGAVIDRPHGSAATRYGALSIAVVPPSGADASRAAVTTGDWAHLPSPSGVPSWLVARRAFSGIVVAAVPEPYQLQLVVRAAVATPDRERFVIVDLPLDERVSDGLYERTGTRLGSITASGCGPLTGEPASGSRSVWLLFQETVSLMDCTRWDTGVTGSLSVRVEAPLGHLADRLASVQSSAVTDAVDGSWWAMFVRLLVVLGVLFLIIQGSALVVGGVLARSITAAVHELFVGTERVQQGDFRHRIKIDTKDQLGDLADSFNRMSNSIEFLLHVQREKQRLDDELRIAREIQKSLLPVQLPKQADVDVASLCEPAREVGGDYYDFFDVGPRQLGVLVADVSGKGTSAALYMAELKGLMLELSQTERSPKRLLITVNRLLSEHLDNRSFITMTYAVLDLERGVMTSARAGHTPLVVVSSGEGEVVAPGGMVLGLRFPGASERFDQVLEEDVRPIMSGDVIVLYTDGITEAMDMTGNLFGEASLVRVVVAQRHLDAAGIRERVVREVRSFVGDAEPHDDMTMVILRILEAA